MTGLILFGTLVVFMVIGVPVSFAILLSCLAYLLTSDIALTVVSQQLVTGMNSFVLLAIPLLH